MPEMPASCGCLISIHWTTAPPCYTGSWRSSTVKPGIKGYSTTWLTARASPSGLRLHLPLRTPHPQACNNNVHLWCTHQHLECSQSHMIHMIINLNMIFCTHVEHSPTIFFYIYKVLYEKTNPYTHLPRHTHTNCNEFKCVWHWSVS